MKKFLETNNVPSYLAGLLELAGISSVTDLLLVDEKLIDSIEVMVQDGSFSAYVDFNSKQKRIEYFGFDLVSVETFRFRLIDRMKLMKLPELAKAELDKVGKNKR